MTPSPSDATIAARRASFRALHERGCFVIPNPWDRGSARYLASLGFPALATTSSGAAFARGKSDGAMSVDDVLDHVREIVGATDLPVNADFEDGHGADLAELEANVARCLDSGAAALSIEDSTGDASRPLYGLEEAVERLRAAKRVIADRAPDAMLVGRAECFLVGHPDPLRESVRRLEAYAEAGADVLYAPAVIEADDIRTIVRAVAPRPVNVLALPRMSLTLAELEDIGVRRVSVGGGLALAAWQGFMRVAQSLRDGRLDGLVREPRNSDLNALFDAM